MTDISPPLPKHPSSSTNLKTNITLNETTKNILKIDTDSITKKFFFNPNSFQDMTITDHQKMFNQFKDVLKLVDEFKKENSGLVSNSPIRSNGKVSIFNSEELKSPFPGVDK